MKQNVPAGMPLVQAVPSASGVPATQVLALVSHVSVPEHSSMSSQSLSIVQVRVQSSRQPSLSSPFMPSSQPSPGSTSRLPQTGEMHIPMWQTRSPAPQESPRISAGPMPQRFMSVLQTPEPLQALSSSSSHSESTSQVNSQRSVQPSSSSPSMPSSHSSPSSTMLLPHSGITPPSPPSLASGTPVSRPESTSASMGLSPPSRRSRSKLTTSWQPASARDATTAMRVRISLLWVTGFS